MKDELYRKLLWNNQFEFYFATQLYFQMTGEIWDCSTRPLIDQLREEKKEALDG